MVGRILRWRPSPRILLAFLVLAGLVLRLDQILGQIPADDEWHALHALRDHGFAWIFTHFGSSDYSIPLTLLDKLVAETVGLDEIGLRAVPLLAGAAALLVLPRLLRPYVGEKTSLVFAGLLAISPLHVYFSRLARSYSLVLLLSIVGAIAFERWRRGPSDKGTRWAIAYAVCAILLPWVHLAYLPFAIAPFAWLVLERVFARQSGPAPRGAWLVAVCVVAGWAALLAPPLLTEFGAVSQRAGSSRSGVGPSALHFQLLTGASEPLLAFAAGLVLVLGLVAGLRRQRGILLYVGFLVACQLAAVFVVAPIEMRTELTMIRYVLPALFLVLLLEAIGLAHLDELVRKEWRRAPAHLASCALPLALLVFGPLRVLLARPNQWTNAAYYQFEYGPAWRYAYAKGVLGVQTIPPFYLKLRQDPDADATIVEAPWYYAYPLVPFPVYQFVHRHPMRIGFVGSGAEPPPLGELQLPDPRFRFRNFVSVRDVAALRASGVRYVIFHRKPPVIPAEDWYASTSDVLACIDRYRAEVGAPSYEDEDLVVFDLVRANPPR